METDNPADNVGGPIEAEDDDGDTPTYALSGADAVMFRVRANGQIEVSDKAMLDHEENSSHTVTLTATDSSDAANNSASIRVTIYVTDLDEAPMIRASTGGVIITDGPRSVRINEEDSTSTTVGTYIADPAGAALSLSGDDAGDFRWSSNGALVFRSTPDYETPMDANGDNVYMVTVTATEGEKTATRHVTVTVINVNEPGEVTLSTTRPQVGTAITANLTDEDGMLSSVRWQWERSESMGGPYSNIPGATSAVYTPVEADAKMYLQATAFYTDGHGSGKSESGMSEQKVYAAPVFATATAERSVAENTATGENIGDPVEATDAANDTLTYTLGGTDMASFAIDMATGQLMTMADLDFEMKASYSVTVTVSDGEERATVMVTVMVTNVEEMGMVTLSAMQPTVGMELTAMLSDLDDGITGTTWQWATSSDMSAWTDIEDATSASYTPVDGDAGSYLQATAMYTDGHGSGKSESGMSEQKVNTAPDFAVTPAERSVAEDTAAGENIGDPVEATDADNDTLTYTLGGDDMASFAIDPDTGQLMTMEALDFETKASYSVTVTASDGKDEATVMVTVMVTNVDEMGMVTLPAMQPRVGVELTAMLSDLDDGITGATWQWATSSDMSAWTDIEDATSASYTPVDGDANMYLRATAMYTDGHGPDKSKMAVSGQQVTANTAPEFATATAERSVAENAAAGMDIGAPVEATDADNDVLTYTLGGTDMASFAIDPDTGQLMTMEALDFETKASYSVTVTASDGEEEATVMVTIMVTDVGLDNGYDVDDSGVIEESEMRVAVGHFYADPPQLTEEEMRTLVGIYFSS